MLELNLPACQFNVKKRDGKFFIFDSQRKRFVVLTPEEWVRQHFVRFLVDEKGYPAALLAVEHQLTINNMKRRCDVVLFNRVGEPQLIVELKAPSVPISQAVFDQVAVYNSKLKVEFFFISNGLEHFACKVDMENGKYVFLPTIPDYSDLLTKDTDENK